MNDKELLKESQDYIKLETDRCYESEELAEEVKKLKSFLIEYEFALAETEALLMSHEEVIKKRDAQIKLLKKWQDDAFCHVEISRNYLYSELQKMVDDGSGVINQLKQLKDEADRLVAEAEGETNGL